MTKKHNYESVSPQTKEEAMKMAKATQRSGQTKEQTRLISQGIEKGISHYKKQQKERSRELNKKLSKVSRDRVTQGDRETSSVSLDPIPVGKKANTLPWVLLVLSWIGFVSFYLSQK